MRKYEAALAINPVKVESIYSWGNCLLYEARMKTGYRPEEAGTDLGIFCILLLVLSSRLLTIDVVADKLFLLCRHKYERVLQLNPRHTDALISYGRAVRDQMALKEGYVAYYWCIIMSVFLIDALVGNLSSSSSSSVWLLTFIAAMIATSSSR